MWPLIWQVLLLHRKIIGNPMFIYTQTCWGFWGLLPNRNEDALRPTMKHINSRVSVINMFSYMYLLMYFILTADMLYMYLCN